MTQGTQPKAAPPLTFNLQTVSSPEPASPQDPNPAKAHLVDNALWLVVAIIVTYLLFSAIYSASCTTDGTSGGVSGMRAESGGVSGRVVATGGPAAAEAGVADSNAVTELTSLDQLDEVIRKPVPTVVLFHASWCGHCKEMMPAFLKAAEAHAGAVSEVYRVECGSLDHNALARHGVMGFPTLLRFGPDGSRREFAKSRTEGNFLKFFKGE